MNEIGYWKEGRTPEKLGISGLSVDELKRFVTERELHPLNAGIYEEKKEFRDIDH